MIFAEPVGSCITILATTLHPLREYADRYRLALYTVLVDPARAQPLLAKGADPDLHYPFSKLIAEADLVRPIKSDLYPNAFDLPDELGRSVLKPARESRHGSMKCCSERVQWCFVAGCRLRALRSGCGCSGLVDLQAI